jgi:DNA-3-methyladenine glycosylase II
MVAAARQQQAQRFFAEGQLVPRQPYSFARTLRFLTTFTPCAGEQEVTAAHFSKAIRLDGQTVVFRVEGTDAKLRYRLTSDRPIAKELAAKLARKISDYLSLDDDLAGFYAKATRDPALAVRAERMHGFHQVRFLTAIEIGVWSVLAQRTPIAMARRVKQAFVEKYGHALEIDGQIHRAFPEASDLAKARGEELKALIKNERKTRYLLAVIQAFQNLDEQRLRGGSWEEAIEWLQEIDGIGAWSSAFILFRGLGRTDRCPLTVPILHAARAVYGEQKTEQEIQRVLDGYGSDCGYWALHLRASE